MQRPADTKCIRELNPSVSCCTSLGFSRSSIFLSVPGLKTTSSKLQSCWRTTCLKVMASIFFDMAPEKISSLSLSLLAFSLTFTAGRNSRVETVLWSSEEPGNTVSTTMAGIPDSICSSAAWPPSAAAAVRACWKSTAPTRVSRAESFS